MHFDSLLQEAENEEIQVVYGRLKGKLKGLYGDNVIIIGKHIKKTSEKSCVLAEELGHYHTTVGDILDQKKLTNRKQERRARGWAYKRLVPLEKLIAAHKAGVKNQHELAEFLEVTEQLVIAAIKYYKQKHGSYCRVENYWICFEPLGVIEIFE